jgi:hypothetical protein
MVLLRDELEIAKQNVLNSAQNVVELMCDHKHKVEAAIRAREALSNALNILEADTLHVEAVERRLVTQESEQKRDKSDGHSES